MMNLHPIEQCCRAIRPSLMDCRVKPGNDTAETSKQKIWAPLAAEPELEFSGATDQSQTSSRDQRGPTPST